jgi:hypothetical protein
MRCQILPLPVPSVRRAAFSRRIRQDGSIPGEFSKNARHGAFDSRYLDDRDSVSTQSPPFGFLDVYALLFTCFNPFL